ncbi:MAG: hypothetical protein E7240_01180 [Lachnospiraceae bacterium]|nr:hypothetical protein [Lachnospiraceae bacterium]
MRIMTVLDSERSYTESFARMLSREKAFPYEVHAFTDPSGLTDFLKSKHAALSLIAEKDYTSEMSSLPSDRIVILKEDRKNPECERLPGIRKYQPFPAVLQEILLYADATALALMEEQTSSRSQIIGVGSPVRRCGNTLFSLALARLLADTRPTLFVTADPCSGLSRLFRGKVPGSLTDLLYDLGASPDGSVRDLRELTVSAGPLRILSPFALIQDALDLTTEDLSSLFKCFCRCRFETIVFDAGLFIYDPVPLVRMCAHFYMPTLPDPVSSGKLSEFVDSLTSSRQDDILDCITQVRLPLSAEIPAAEDLPDRLLSLPVSSYAMKIIRKDRL